MLWPPKKLTQWWLGCTPQKKNRRAPLIDLKKLGALCCTLPEKKKKSANGGGPDIDVVPPPPKKIGEPS